MAKKPQKNREDNELWSYVPPGSRRKVNRVRVYERRDSPTLYIEWHDDEGRHREPLMTPSGIAVTDKALAVKIADRAAAAQMLKRQASAAAELLGLPEQHTLQELLDRLHADRESKWSVTYRKDQKRFKKFWLTALGAATQLAKINEARVERAVRTAAEANKWGGRTQQAHLRYIIDAFGYAQRKLKWIEEKQALTGTEMPKVDSESKPYSVEELLRLLPKTHEVDLRCGGVSELAYGTGRRLNAIRTLPVSAIAIETLKLRDVEREVMVVRFPGETDKARKKGLAILPASARAAVERLMETPAVRASGWLFPSGDLDSDQAKREPIEPGELIDMLHAAEVLAEVPKVAGRAYHGMKRRTATMGRKAMGDMTPMARQSGTTKATLERIYDQDDVEDKVELAEKLEALRGD